MVHFLLYKSRALFPRDVNDQTVGIAKVSFVNNKRDGMTGFLHAEHGAFYQYFEGEMLAVEAFFDRVRADKRRSRVTLIVSGETDKQLFSDFELGFSSASGRKIADSFSEFPDQPSAQTIIQFLKEARDEQSSA